VKGTIAMAQIEVDDHTHRQLELLAAGWQTSIAAALERLITTAAEHAAVEREVSQWWSCPGCGTSIDASQADLVVEHVRDCDRVDGAGQPVSRRRQ
jgi:hypothetical protein